VRQYAAVTAYNATVYTSPLLADGVHNIRIVLTGVVPTGSTGTDISVDTIITR
jgi:hypothetical protein